MRRHLAHKATVASSSTAARTRNAQAQPPPDTPTSELLLLPQEHGNSKSKPNFTVRVRNQQGVPILPTPAAGATQGELKHNFSILERENEELVQHNVALVKANRNYKILADENAALHVQLMVLAKQASAAEARQAKAEERMRTAEVSSATAA